MADKVTYTVDEIHEMTGFSKRSVLDKCKAGELAHVHFGNTYAMTMPQIQALIERYTVTPEPMAEVDDPDRQRVLAEIARGQNRQAA